VTTLALEGIRKRFGNVPALVDASLSVRAGTVHALLGENGAGKTTLMRIAYGIEFPDSGSIRVDGSVVRFSSPASAIAHRIGMVHQHFTLVPQMTVAENVALGGHGRFDVRATSERIRELGEASGLVVEPDARVADLSITAQQRLELLKVLARDAQVLILDEPTAVLTPTEAGELLRHIRHLADEGRAVVLITHKLREALSIADDITVLRRGVTTLAKRRGDVDQDDLLEAMLGQRTIQSETKRNDGTVGPVVIAAEDVSVTDRRGLRIRNASFVVRAGEIVGVAAVEGSGHRELLRAVSRRLRVSGGSLTTPSVVGFVPDDRHRDGLVLAMSLAENFALRGAGESGGLILWRNVANATRDTIREFDVRATGPHALAGELSGGNQQKFVLGRELQGPPPALVVENATRGLDVRAAAYISDRLLLARSSGVAIMAYSTDLDEVLGIADRMLVVFDGMVREVPVDGDLVGRAMLGAA
jgi:simple sugar transport system ATP-binding protein